MTIEEKVKFLMDEVPAFFGSLDADAKPAWGQMSSQNVVEHMVIGMKISNGKVRVNLHTPEDKLPAYKEFIMGPKEFRPNTKNPVMADTPPPVHYPDMKTAVEKLLSEIRDFFSIYREDNKKITLHPIFGEFDYEGWLQMHYKHFLHHMKQFGYNKS